MEVEKIKREIPKEVNIEIDIEEYFPDYPEAKPFISFDLLEAEEEGQIESIKDALRDKGYKEEDIDKALEEVDIKFNYYLILPEVREPIKLIWEPTDPWRGHYSLDIPEVGTKKAEKVVNTDSPVKMDLVYVARDPAENERFLETAIELLGRYGFRAIPILLPTSNVFGVNGLLVVAPAPAKAVFNRTDLDFLKEFDDTYTEKYTGSFSVMTGTTKPIDPFILELVRDVKRMAERKGMEVIG